MTANSDRVSAQIFQFPARGRFASATNREEKSVAGLTSPRIAKVAMGSGWYHEAAIQDAERDRES
jgi:uncharacterized protein DUF2735